MSPGSKAILSDCHLVHGSSLFLCLESIDSLIKFQKMFSFRGGNSIVKLSPCIFQIQASITLGISIIRNIKLVMPCLLSLSIRQKCEGV